ncbi:MAG TPA: hypothetical protein VF092_13375 [Longimicrobium sp.]
MTRAPHPALRRLLAAAAASARAVEALDAPRARLMALQREPGELDALAESALGPLAGGVDLGAVLGRVLEPRTDGAAAAIVPARDRRAARPLVGLGGDDEARRADAPSRAGDERPAPRRAPISSGGDTEGRAARAPSLAHDAEAVERVLAPYLPGETRRSTAGAVPSDRRAGDRAAPEASPVTAGRAARGIASEASHLPTALPSRAEAAEALRRRGPNGAMETPVAAGEPLPRVAALLASAAEDARREASGRASFARSADVAAPPAEDAATPPDPASRLADALQRVSAARARSHPPVEGRGEPGGIGGGWPSAASADAPSPPISPIPPTPPMPAVGGLRGLVARAEAAGQTLPAPSTPHPSRTGEAPAGVLAARLEEAELAERLDRLLRREALRQGIDLDGVGP